MSKPTFFTREELHRRLWTEPTVTVAAEIGVSNVALKKACDRANIPVPGRGYWARREAGQSVAIEPLPLRFPGGSNLVAFGGAGWERRGPEVDLDKPIPPPPTFDEPMDSVAKRASALVGEVKIVDPARRAHPAIAILLQQDDERRKEQLGRGYLSSWDAPRFDDPSGKRWLRLVNSLFLKVQELGCSASMTRSKHADLKRDLVLTIGSQHSYLRLVPAEGNNAANEKSRRVKLDLLEGPGDYHGVKTICTWKDEENKRLEVALGEILADLLVRSERGYRHNIAAHHEWLIQRQQEIAKEKERRRIEEERREKERLAKVAQDSIDRLLAQARALDQASTIRDYVSRVLSSADKLGVEASLLEQWGKWALQEADRIDPVMNGSLLNEIEKLRIGGCDTKDGGGGRDHS